MPPTELAERRGGLRPRGPLTMAERHARLAFAAECARHKDAVVEFWFKTMMDKKADRSHRVACSHRLMNRAFGVPVSGRTCGACPRQVTRSAARGLGF